LVVIKKTLGKDIEELNIIPIADYHIGDSLCNYDLIRREIEEVKNNKNTYAILDGDILNWASKTSVSDVYSETLSPMEELEKAIELLTPIKDKILAMNGGNHERRASKTEGIDLTYIIAKQLGLEDVCSNGSSLIFLRFGNDKRNKRVCYKIFSAHGSRSGSQEGSKMQALADLEKIIDADVYIHAHTHLPATFMGSHIRTNEGNSSARQVDVLFANTGSKLKYGGYGETGCFKPQSSANCKITLSGKTRYLRGVIEC